MEGFNWFVSPRGRNLSGSGHSNGEKANVCHPLELWRIGGQDTTACMIAIDCIAMCNTIKGNGEDIRNASSIIQEDSGSQNSQPADGPS
jgi:predicted small secreted protein